MHTPPTAAVSSLNRKIYLGAPAVEIWEWLVDPERSARYHPGRLDERPLAVGEPMRYQHKLGGQLLIDGVVEELVETRRLRHTFQFQFQEPDEPSVVTYELVPYGEEMCRLDVLHEGLDPATETWSTMNQSWDAILSSLKTLVETGRPLPWPGRNVDRIDPLAGLR